MARGQLINMVEKQSSIHKPLHYRYRYRLEKHVMYTVPSPVLHSHERLLIPPSTNTSNKSTHIFNWVEWFISVHFNTLKDPAAYSWNHGSSGFHSSVGPQFHVSTHRFVIPWFCGFMNQKVAFLLRKSVKDHLTTNLLRKNLSMYTNTNPNMVPTLLSYFNKFS